MPKLMNVFFTAPQSWDVARNEMLALQLSCASVPTISKENTNLTSSGPRRVNSLYLFNASKS